MKKNIVILVAAHKKYAMPKDEMYLPIHVGKAGKDNNLGYVGDDTGDNISEKNASWCELTGLYWGWKNLDCNYLGLVQYRRHFRYSGRKNKLEGVLNYEEAVKLLQETDVILPKSRNYYFMTLEQHYEGYDFSISDDLNNFRQIIFKLCPEYIWAVESVLSRKKGHMCNMFIMKKELVDRFCEWEFMVLEEFEKTLDASRKRIVGYLAEHMLDIWLEKNQISYEECDVALLDRKNEIDRRIDFLMRKLGFSYRRIRLVQPAVEIPFGGGRADKKQ